jgi:hypothetical protein
MTGQFRPRADFLQTLPVPRTTQFRRSWSLQLGPARSAGVHGQARLESLPVAHARRAQQAAGLQNRQRRRTSDYDLVASARRRARRQSAIAPR